MNLAGTQVAEANRSLEGMVQSMGAIGGASEKIARIIKIIDEIAFQTNILALNAAVEAARAGEAGVGFAVVADEVRNLATRCAQAAKDTNDLIAESIDATRIGQTRLDEMAEAIRGITESSGSVRGLVNDVNGSSNEQARNVQEMAQSLAEVEGIAQQSTSGAEQNSASIATVTKQAEAMAATFEELARQIQF
jgi:methyl-accepting chemotaxis protein